MTRQVLPIRARHTWRFKIDPCETSFDPPRAGAKFCSVACQMRTRRRRARGAQAVEQAKPEVEA
jgi:hypothetical protein